MDVDQTGKQVGTNGNADVSKLEKSTKTPGTLDEIILESRQMSGTPPQGNKAEFKPRILWPDVIKTPVNPWIFSCKEIIEKLGMDPQQTTEMKRSMEKCLIYFYTLKKKLNLFDHTYTASCILFFRYWFIYGLPSSIPECIHISQAILVTACKTMENNRPIDAYVKATCEFLTKDLTTLKSKQNMDKLKWDVRDKLVSNEKRILCSFGFDLNIENPKELIEEMFSGYYRFNRDFDLPEEFKTVFPKILQEARNFIVQAVTQPVSLLCDGYSFVALSLIYCGLQYQKLIDKTFKYPKNFFRDKFPVAVTSKQYEEIFTDYRLIEENFFDLKSNKREKLQISAEEIKNLIEEDINETEEITAALNNPYDYEHIKTGEVRQELLDHISKRIKELYEKTVNDTKKRSLADPQTNSDQLNKKSKV
ncbi:hypothetical protein HG535_0F04750 [Zygotorulaspora mrakii]|uniref:Cyclin N-terminal domain-containing protein n=1 Tax=Zygotorulaspora mrakii TaxID=42260 RepID=A0A7H9B633_ZYGMR|nr:uncharacterized protein HG535_0F04750 [Zygotorulaspora mrakii]QLG73963.1 hypothetical protein HG535_0F04750 [Zygotorulaspora mrakii]